MPRPASKEKVAALEVLKKDLAALDALKEDPDFALAHFQAASPPTSMPGSVATMTANAR